MVIMARIKYGNGIADIRGSINGTTFSRNASGAYARNRTAPTNANSTAQVAQRSLFQALTTGWRALTEEQRASWNVAAPNFPQTNSLGETVILTGQQLYMKLNGAMQSVGAAPSTTAPSPVEMPSVQVAITELSATEMALSLDSDATEAYFIKVEASAPVSAGTTKSNSVRFRKVGQTTGSSTTIDLKATYAAVYGTRDVGAKVFYRVYLVSPRGQQVKVADISGIVGE